MAQDRTALFGKYLNDYDKVFPKIPPGWDLFGAFVSFNELHRMYYDYNLSTESGQTIHYGENPADYSTRVITEKAVTFIKSTPSDKPLFLYFAPFAPHTPARPDPEDKGRFDNEPVWRPASYNESDVSDKPQWIKSRPLISSGEKDASDKFHRKILETLQSVDRSVKKLVDALEESGKLENTIIVFTSDQGLAWGEHRILDEKECVYDECVKVPFLVRAPGVSPRTESKMISFEDIAATIVDWAEITSPTTDGNSFVPLLKNPSLPWKTEVLLEHQVKDGSPDNPGSFQAVRTGDSLYAEYVNGDREFYDLATDPYQLTNRVNDPVFKTRIDTLKIKLEELKKK